MTIQVSPEGLTSHVIMPISSLPTQYPDLRSTQFGNHYIYVTYARIYC